MQYKPKSILLIAAFLLPAHLSAQSDGQHGGTGEPAFATFDGRERSIEFVQAGAAEASRDKIAILVWTGNSRMQQIAYDTARELHSEGMSLALILGPSLSPHNNDASIQVYAQGISVFEGAGSQIGINYIDTLSDEIRRMANIANRNGF